MDFIFDLDYKIIDFLQNNGPNEVLDPFIIFITKIGDSGFIWFLIIGILLLIKKQRKVGIVSFLSIGMASVLGEFLLKNLVQRERPFRVIEGINLIVDPPGDFSFPSMHAGSSFAVACVLLFYWGWKASPFMALAIGIAASRAYLFVHFPSDTMVGAVLGIMTACIAIAFDQVVNIDAILDKIYAKFGRKKKSIENTNEEDDEEYQDNNEKDFDENNVDFEADEDFGVSFDTGEYNMNFDTAQFNFDTAQFNFDNLDDFEYINPNPSVRNNNAQTSNMGMQAPVQRQRTPMSRQSVSSSMQSMTRGQTGSIPRQATNSVNQMAQIPMQTTAPVQRQTASVAKPARVQENRRPEMQQSVKNQVNQELLHENEMPKRRVKKKVQKPVQQPIMKQKPVAPRLPNKTNKPSIQQEEDDFMEFYNKRKEEVNDDFDFDFRI